jgi:hypothetical protein
VLNTLQYLIVDEILLARVLEQPQKVPPGEEYTDETDEETEDYMDNEGTEYNIRKGRPVIV